MEILDNIRDKLVVLREQPILLDRDVAEIYGVETKRVNEAVRNNPEKFPKGYVFELQSAEKQQLVENFDQFKKLKHSPVSPHAFTEKGLYMLATILKSEAATQATLGIIETFAKVRSLKHDIISLHTETDPDKQKSMMQRFSDALTDIVMPDLQVSETESTLELNFIVGKLKHTVKRTKRSDE